MQLTVVSKLLEHYSGEEAIDLAADMGFDGMEFFAIPGHVPVDTPIERIKDLARRAKDRNLAITVLGTYSGNFSQLGDEACLAQIEEFKRHMEFAEIFGTKIVRMWTGGPVPAKAREDHYLRAAHYIAMCADLAKPSSISVSIETIQVLPVTVNSVVKLLKLIDRSNVGVTYDPGGMLNFEPDYALPAIAAFGDRILNVHLKDRTREEGIQFMGEGVVPYPDIIRELKARGFDGSYSVECHKEHSVPAIKREYAAAVKLLGITAKNKGVH